MGTGCPLRRSADAAGFWLFLYLQIEEAHLSLGHAVLVRSPEEIEGIREACLIARRILDAGHAAVRPGVTTEEIDCVVRFNGP